MEFGRLQLTGWRQFSLVDIKFHPNLTIITGANGAGKSTLLNILGQNIGASRPYLATPGRVRGSRKFLSGIFSFPTRIAKWFQPSEDENWADIGFLHYQEGGKCALRVPTQGQQQYGLTIVGQQAVIGFHMPSHRAMTNYRQIPNVAFGGINPKTAFGTLIGELYSVFHGNRSELSVLYHLKVLIANWAVFGEGNSAVGRDDEQREAYKGFIDVLSQLLPLDLGFVGLKVNAPDIVVQTKTGEFLIDSLSGGLTAIMEMAALIYTRSLMDDVPDGRFVVTMDEPENHLHPAMQRTILSSLVKVFPRVQFIVATHSPFIVSSSRNSFVYALKYEDIDVVEESSENSPRGSRRVNCIFLEKGQLSTSPNEILREVLGVPVTFPAWIEESLEEIIARYRIAPFNDQTIADLQKDVEEAGLSHLFPEAALQLGRTN